MWLQVPLQMTATHFEGNVSMEMAENMTLILGFFPVSFHSIYFNLSRHRKEA